MACNCSEGAFQDQCLPDPLISCSHSLPEGSLSVLVGRHGAMNPAGRVGCNMSAGYRQVVAIATSSMFVTGGSAEDAPPRQRIAAIKVPGAYFDSSCKVNAQ